MLHRIRSAVVREGRAVEIVFEDERVAVIDFTPVIARGGVFALLRDQEVFSRVAVGKDGRTLEWPGELDFCADALWLKAYPEEDEEPGADHDASRGNVSAHSDHAETSA